MFFKKICLALSLVMLVSLVSAKTTVMDKPDVQQKLTINVDKEKDTISRHIYGHFAEHLGRCVYEGFWVGEDSNIPNVKGIRTDVVEALKKIKVPVLRWPGGCFADKYHWKDGIGPRDERPRELNTFWGGVIDDNSFGTHEFLTLCEMLDTDAYIAGNVGSGTVHEMQDWIEYMTADQDCEMARLRRENGRDKPWKVPFFGVGNENWGCGGDMTPEYYSDLYKRYQSYVVNLSGNHINKIACGPGGTDYNWVEVVMKNAHHKMDAIAQHYYVFSNNWGDKGRATEFTTAEWLELMDRSVAVDDVINKDIEIMNKYDKRKRVALYVDEWGTWWNEEPGTKAGFLYQQNTIRDAVSASIFLNTFNQHCDRVKMANIAQINNVLQAMVLTDKEKMIVTPTYHVFEMFTVHHDAKLLDSELVCNPLTNKGKKIPALSASASKDKAGKVHVTLTNIDPESPAEVACDITGMTPNTVTGRILANDALNAHNTFENPDVVKPARLRGIEIDGQTIKLRLPAGSVAVLEIQ